MSRETGWTLPQTPAGLTSTGFHPSFACRPARLGGTIWFVDSPQIATSIGQACSADQQIRRRATVATQQAVRTRERGNVAERLAHRDLRNRSAEVLREVQSGTTYEITNHGEVVAVLAPATPRHRADLRIRRASRRGGFTSLPRVRRDRPVQQSLDELRGDR